MSERERYPASVPCWVETLQPDPQAALAFYGPLFGWEFVGPGRMPGDPPGQYFVARVRGRDVAGIGSVPDRRRAAAPAWSTYIRVDDADEIADRAKKHGGLVVDGPFDVPPAGRMAALADPVGALFCLWQAGVREGAQLVNEPSAWAMSLLHTTAPDRATAFYGALFGWRAEPFGPPAARMALWRLPGYVGGEPQQPVPRDVVAAMVGGNGGNGGNGGPAGAMEVQPHWSVNFWIDDADAAAERAARLGGKFVVPPHDVPGFRTTVLADPQGAAFSVSQKVVGP